MRMHMQFDRELVSNDDDRSSLHLYYDFTTYRMKLCALSINLWRILEMYLDWQILFMTLVSDNRHMQGQFVECNAKLTEFTPKQHVRTSKTFSSLALSEQFVHRYGEVGFCSDTPIVKRPNGIEN